MHHHPGGNENNRHFCLLSKDGTLLVTGCRNFVIPDGVKVIAKCAFWGCQTLERINIPDTVTEICDDAFHFCLSLKSITILDSVKSIGHSAFRYCYSIEAIRTGNPEIVKGTGATNAKIVKC